MKQISLSNIVSPQHVPVSVCVIYILTLTNSTFPIHRTADNTLKILRFISKPEMELTKLLYGFCLTVIRKVFIQQ